MPALAITFLSDYGLTDHFVGVCHGVIARICPEARIIDISHGVPRHDVQAGALMLLSAVPFMPAAVHLAVVDPEVGAQRRAVALRLGDGRLLVGPDNGLLSPLGERCGGVVEAVDIAHSRFRLEPVSATFHGRDLFAPVAAQLAAGTELADVGTPCDPAELVRLALPGAHREGEIWVAHALYIDRFGNVGLDIAHDQLAGLKLGHTVRLTTGSGEQRATYVRTFAEVEGGELLVYEDADRRLAVAVTQGDAAAQLQVSVGDELRVGPG